MFLSKKTRKEWYTLWWCGIQGVWVHSHDSKTIRNVREEIRYKKWCLYKLRELSTRYKHKVHTISEYKTCIIYKKHIQNGDRNIQSWMWLLRWRRWYAQVMVDLREHGGVLVQDSCENEFKKNQNLGKHEEKISQGENSPCQIFALATPLKNQSREVALWYLLWKQFRKVKNDLRKFSHWLLLAKVQSREVAFCILPKCAFHKVKFTLRNGLLSLDLGIFLPYFTFLSTFVSLWAFVPAIGHQSSIKNIKNQNQN